MAGATPLNLFPDNMKSTNTVKTFRRYLKTYFLASIHLLIDDL